MKKLGRASIAVAASLAAHAVVLFALPWKGEASMPVRGESAELSLLSMSFPGVDRPPEPLAQAADAAVAEPPLTPPDPVPAPADAPPAETDPPAADGGTRRDLIVESGGAEVPPPGSKGEAAGISSEVRAAGAGVAEGAGAAGPAYRDADTVDQKPRFAFQASIKYPPQAKRERLEGLVVLLVDVDERGRVMKVSVDSSTDAIFEDAAVAMAEASRFTPARAQGKPVAVRLRLPVRFTIK